MTDQNPAEPTIIDRGEQPYLFITTFTTMPELSETAPRVQHELFSWFGARGVPFAGIPFWKYNVVDMDKRLEIEVGVPVAAGTTGGDRVEAGILPAGRYATLLHVGHPMRLAETTAALLDWGVDQGLHWDVEQSSDGDRWAARLEIYETNPVEEPNLEKWRTRIAIRLR